MRIFLTIIKAAYRVSSAAVVAAAVLLLAYSAVGAQVSGVTRYQEGKPSSLQTTRSVPHLSPQVSALIAQLRSPDRAQREQAAGKLRQMQGTVGQQLLGSARQQVREAQEARKTYADSAEKRTPAKQNALAGIASQKAVIASQTIRLLGELHSEEAIPFLLENIRFVDPEQDSRYWNFPSFLPCLGALIRLGLPAADATLHWIEEALFREPSSSVDDSVTESEKWGEQVLGFMLGPRVAVGYLQDRIDTLKERQTVAPSDTSAFLSSGKPAATPLSVRIERLKVVRSHIEAHTKGWMMRSENIKPEMP